MALRYGAVLLSEATVVTVVVVDQVGAASVLVLAAPTPTAAAESTTQQTTTTTSSSRRHDVTALVADGRRKSADTGKGSERGDRDFFRRLGYAVGLRRWVTLVCGVWCACVVAPCFNTVFACWMCTVCNVCCEFVRVMESFFLSLVLSVLLFFVAS